MVDHHIGTADPGLTGADLRAYAWIIAILRMLLASADRMADHLREQKNAPTFDRDQYVRDSRELWDRYRYLVSIYDDVAWSLSDPFKASFKAWQTAFLESDAGDDPVVRARHYQAAIIRFFERLASAALKSRARH